MTSKDMGEPMHGHFTDSKARTNLQGRRDSIPAQHFHASQKVISSTSLFGDAHVVNIEHLGQLYRLQATRAGKLILTK